MHLNSAGQPSNGPPNPLASDIKLADIHKDCMRDPLNPTFYDDVWSRVAENNTKIFRRVFRVMPDSEATNWAEYNEFKEYNARFKASLTGEQVADEKDAKNPAQPSPRQPAAPGRTAMPSPPSAAKAVTEKVASSVGRNSADKPNIADDRESGINEKTALAGGPRPSPRIKDTSITDPEKAAAAEGVTPFPTLDGMESQGQPLSPTNNSMLKPDNDSRRERRTTFSGTDKPPNTSASGASFNTSHDQRDANAEPINSNAAAGATGTAGRTSVRRRRRTTTRGSRGRRFSGNDELLSRAEAEELLSMTQGALVQFPYDWLVVEESNGNWMYQVDLVAPLQI
jgi:phospholipase D1/2